MVERNLKQIGQTSSNRQTPIEVLFMNGNAIEERL
jgi:hypothetical protein